MYYVLIKKIFFEDLSRVVVGSKWYPPTGTNNRWDIFTYLSETHYVQGLSQPTFQLEKPDGDLIVLEKFADCFQRVDDEDIQVMSSRSIQFNGLS